MDLTRLSLGELEELQTRLGRLIPAKRALVEHGIPHLVRSLPAQPVVIVLTDGDDIAPEAAPAGAVILDAVCTVERRPVVEPEPEISSDASLSSPAVAEVSEESRGGAGHVAPAAMPQIKGSAWSLEDDATAVRLALAGATARIIAEKLGRTIPAVQFRLKTRLAEHLGKKPLPSTVRTPAVSPIPAPTTVRVAPRPAPPPVAVAKTVDMETPGWLRELRERLVSIGNPPPFTPAVDLEIVERLARGEKGAFVATGMGIDLHALKKRHIALLPDVGQQAQARLLAELRLRVAGGVAA